MTHCKKLKFFQLRGVAQLVVRMVRDHKVGGSIPFAPTNKIEKISKKSPKIAKKMIKNANFTAIFIIFYFLCVQE